jgi:uncharacterized protein DUF6632
MTHPAADAIVSTAAERASLDALRQATGAPDTPMERHCVRVFLMVERMAADQSIGIDRVSGGVRELPVRDRRVSPRVQRGRVYERRSPLREASARAVWMARTSPSRVPRHDRTPPSTPIAAPIRSGGRAPAARRPRRCLPRALAARDPAGNRRLLLFTAWSSLAHGVLMAGQAIALDKHGHLAGDVSAMLRSRSRAGLADAAAVGLGKRRPWRSRPPRTGTR